MDSCADEHGFELVFDPVELVPRIPVTFRYASLTRGDLSLYMDDDGRVDNPQALKKHIFTGVGWEKISNAIVNEMKPFYSCFFFDSSKNSGIVVIKIISN